MAVPGSGSRQRWAAKAIAFYLPQFQPTADIDGYRADGDSGWARVRKAVPQFLGHHQPQMPVASAQGAGEPGELLRRQIALAGQYGIHGFCFHYFWRDGERRFEQPLQEHVAGDSGDFPFCLFWSNEGGDPAALMDDLLPYLTDRRYVRVDGRPLLCIRWPEPRSDCRTTLEHWRAVCRQQGLGELFLAAADADCGDPGKYGFDAAFELPPHFPPTRLQPINSRLTILNPDYRGQVVEYADMVDAATARPPSDFPLIRGVCPAWDDEASNPGRGFSCSGASPAGYRAWLEAAVRYAWRFPVRGEQLVFINAWNDWSDGAHLEPDGRDGLGFLTATREALEIAPEPGKILLIVHDAYPHGAQYLALNMLRELREEMHLDVEVLLLGPGGLRADFEKLATVHECFDAPVEAIEALAVALKAQGCRLVLANTAVSGLVIKPFHEAGIRVVSLIHELPGVIRQYRLVQAVCDMFSYSDRLVVATDAVREGLGEFVSESTLEAMVTVLPQGLFVRSRYRGSEDRSAVRSKLRASLGLPANARIVLAVGYADRRKGVDLFVEIAIVACRADPSLHFLWVGHPDLQLVAARDARLRQAGLESHVHFVGLDFDTDDYYAGADVYALTSREEPLGSVVLESLSVATPVIAFARTGGGAELVSQAGGVIVPAFDVGAFANALLALLQDEPRRRALGDSGQALIDAEFSFRAYLIDLLDLGDFGIPRVSVVVPNFNYARYLEQRLRGIAGQTLLPYEIIILDDASTDDSRELIQRLRGELHPEPRLVFNSENSGSVFRQWLRGVELARGDYVWIAEADDLCHPDFLERIVRAMQRDPEIVLGFAQSAQIDEEGRVTAPDYLAFTDPVSKQRWRQSYVASGADEVAAALGINCTIPNVSAAVFRREPLLEVLRNHIEEIAAYRSAGDWPTYLHVLEKGRIFFDPAATNQHRRHAGGVTLGSVLAEHHQEVLAAQALAARLFALDESTRARAAAYADWLADYLGLTAKGPA